MNMLLADNYKLEISKEELWEQYFATRDSEIRNQLVEKYSYLVKIIALKLRGIYQNFGDVDDIVNEGIIALMHVIEKYDISKNTKFETYASIRIKGAIIDYVRKQDWVPRKVKRDYKIVKDAEEILSNKLGRTPSDAEIVEYLKINIKEYNNIINNAYSNSILSFEELLSDSNLLESDYSKGYNLPEHEIETKELYNILIESVSKLSKNEKLVVSLYYKEELKLKEIAKILDLSNSRVSQIHISALQKLEADIKDYLNGNVQSEVIT